jgi:hypothetical protein
MKHRELKTVRFNMRITSSQYEHLKQVAQAASISVSSLVRQGIEWALLHHQLHGEENRQMESGESETQTTV